MVRPTKTGMTISLSGPRDYLPELWREIVEGLRSHEWDGTETDSLWMGCVDLIGGAELPIL